MKPSPFFTLEKQSVDCKCFDTGHNNSRSIFRSDSLNMIQKEKQMKHQLAPHSYRNESEESKHKKKSLRKKRQTSILSEHNSKSHNDHQSHSKRNLDANSGVAPIEKHQEKIHYYPSFAHTNTEKVITIPSLSNQQKQKDFNFFNIDKIHSVKGINVANGTQKPKQSTRLRGNRTHEQIISLKQLYEVSHQVDSKPKGNKMAPPALKYDRELNLNQEFQKDLLEYGKNYENQQVRKKQLTEKQQKEDSQSEIQVQMTYSEVPLRLNVKKPSGKSPARSVSYRGSRTDINNLHHENPSSDCKQSLAKKTRMLPKEIESEGATDSDNQSEVIGRGWNQSSQAFRDQDFQEEDFQDAGNGIESIIRHRRVKDEGNDIRKTNKTQTMATKESNIKHSETKTTLLGEYSQVFTTTKSHDKKNLSTHEIFPFGEKKLGQFGGHSYKHITDLNGKKVNHAKIHFG